MMTKQQKDEYRKLARQVDEAYQKYTNTHTTKAVNLFNNRLDRIQQLLNDV